MKLRAQVAGGLVLLLLLTNGLAAYHLLLTRQLHEANRQLAGVDLELSRSSLSIRRYIDGLQGLTQRYTVLRDPRYVEELRRLRREVEDEIAHLEKLPLADMGPIFALRRLWEEYREQAGELERAVSSGQEVEDELVALLESVSLPYEAARRLDNVATERASKLIDVSEERAATAYTVTLLVAILELALTAGLAYWIGHSTGAPLRALTRGARAMAAGDFDHRVEVSGPTELASLARDFNFLARQLGELDRMKRDFLASVSHDLKAPLASIQQTTRLLLEEESGLPEDQRRFLELNARSAERLEAMITDLLDIARLEVDAVAFQLEGLDLNDCCEEAIDRAAGLLTQKGIAVERRLWDGPLPIRADVALLLQALGNLLTNAVKYSPEGSALDVATRSISADRGSSVVRLHLRDRGPGVPDADKERIFDRFYRSQASADRPSGTGLGLAIARSIIERLGGRIWVEDAPGGGSVFIVELPEAPRSEPAPSGPDPA
jgi:signal transduction histidine kinase